MSTPNVAAVQTLTISGFTKPESAVHDTMQDVYFVSNVGPRNPGALDQNGFISRVSPGGTIVQLSSIGGLNVPKGLCLFDDRLYVADVNTLRIFKRVTGASVAAIAVPNPRGVVNRAAPGKVSATSRSK